MNGVPVPTLRSFALDLEKRLVIEQPLDDLAA